MGGRRKKKGMKERIKEKLPSGHKTDEHGQQGYGHGKATTGPGYEGTTMTIGATGHHDPEKKGFVEKIKERMHGGDKTVGHEQQRYEHGQATMGTGTGYGGTTTTTGEIGHHDLEKKGFVQKIKEKLPGEDKADEHGQQGYGHGQATMGTGTGYGGTTATTPAIGHDDPKKKGFMEKIKQKLPGGDKTDKHGQQGYEHGQATTGTEHKKTSTTTGAAGHHDPEKKGFMEKIKEKLPGHN